jgi:hypothetical protein
MAGTSVSILDRFWCEFLVAANSVGTHEVAGAEICHLPNRWRWRLCLGDFEVVHGVSRVVRLLPDKLSTALAIAKQTQPPPPPDGGAFLIDLVVKLFGTYLARGRTNSASGATVDLRGLPPVVVRVSEDASGPIEELEGGSDLVEILDKLNDGLARAKSLLVAKEFDLFVEHCDRLLGLAQDVEAACFVYLDMAHPDWIWASRTQSLDQLGFRIEVLLRRRSTVGSFIKEFQKNVQDFCN